MKFRCALLVVGLVVLGGCDAPGSPQQATCILGSNYSVDSDVSRHTWDYIRPRFMAFPNLAEVAAGGEFYGPGEGKIAIEFKTGCAAARQYVSRHVDELISETADAGIAAQLRQIDANWREISREEYETILVH
jgi:hypothetical protein